MQIADPVKDCINDVNKRLDDYTNLNAELVNIDSGEDDPDGILKVEKKIAAELPGSETRIEWIETGNSPGHFKATIPGGFPTHCLLGHADTVFERGTASKTSLPCGWYSCTRTGCCGHERGARTGFSRLKLAV